ncbi:MAG TPA: hypothetical protein VMI52_12355 [Acetobacteraceae bacterium]|nr:hypothetical protein [Acetobacteraceae bacterium]
MSRLGQQARNMERYLDPKRTRYLHLADGGISDNLGLRVAGNMMYNLAQSPNAISAAGYDRFRRVLILSIDGQGTQDPSIAQRKAVGGLFAIFGLVSGTQIDRYNFETLNTVKDQLGDFTTALRKARCARGEIVNGAPCDDVKGELIHISLAGMPEGPVKDKLVAIPTGLTISKPDVDLLVDAGRTAITTSRPLQDFLSDYPPPPEGGQFVPVEGSDTTTSGGTAGGAGTKIRARTISFTQQGR